MFLSPLARIDRKAPLAGTGRRLVRCAAWSLAALLSVACSDDGGDDTPSRGKRTMQQPIALADWQVAVDSDPALAGLVAETGLSFQVAGRIEDSLGRTLLWAEYAASATAARSSVVGLYRQCDKLGVCAVGKAVYTDEGAVFAAADGTPVTKFTLGDPVMVKHLQAHNVDKDPTLLGALNQATVVDAALAKGKLGLVKFGQRRCAIVHALGPEVGSDVEAIRAAAAKSGLFDTVEVIHYARRSDVDNLLTALTPLDVLIWVGAGVVEKFPGPKPESPPVKPARPMGMTVSRGVLGDELYSAKTLGDRLDAPPLGGPGLIVLAGANTLHPDYFFDPATLAEGLYQVVQERVVSLDSKTVEVPARYRPVVGFAAELTGPQVVAAVARLLGTLGAGKDLETAMAAAGSSVLSRMDKTERAKWKLPVGNAQVFPKLPSAATLKMHVNGTPKCVKHADTCDSAGFTAAWKKGTTNQVAPADLDGSRTATFDCKPTFTGRFFDCTSKTDYADFWMKGILLGSGLHDRFVVYAEGKANLQFEGLTVLADAVIVRRDEAGGTTRLAFTGEAATTPYVDPEGRCCKASLPMLQTYDSQPGEIVLSH